MLLILRADFLRQTLMSCEDKEKKDEGSHPIEEFIRDFNRKKGL